MRILRGLLALSLMLLVAACGRSGNELTETIIDELRIATKNGPGFNDKLALEYSRLASTEQYENFDYKDAVYFAQKGLDALDGQLVLPATLDDFEISIAHKPSLAAGRSRLVNAFAAGAREQFPAEAARAQGAFDCWMEEQEENWQQTQIAFCMQTFEDAMLTLERLMSPQAMRLTATGPVNQPKQFSIYFAFDQAVINAAGQYVLEDAAATYHQMGYREVVVLGHADRSGGGGYNQTLSDQRADRIRDGLMTHGVPRERITFEARGERDNAVPTRDGVREQGNRRVEIILR